MQSIYMYIYISSCKAARIQYAYLSVCVSKCLWTSVCRRSRVSSEGSLPYCSPLSRPWPLSETQHAIKRSTKELLWGMSLPLSLTLYKSPWTTRRPGMLLVGKHDATLPAGTIQRHKFDTTYGGIKKSGRSLAETLLLISFTEQRSVVISCCFEINQQKTAINC